MPRAHLAAAFASALVAAGAAGCQTDAPAASASTSDGDPSVPGGARRMRRLSVPEYIRVVSDLVGVKVSPDRFLPESSDTGYENGPDNLTVQADQAATFEQLAGELAKPAAAAQLAQCAQAGQDVTACKQAFFDGFATRAFRRPLTSGEANRLGALFDSAAGVAGLSGALETTSLAILQSPGFLYREEIGGAPADDAPGAVRLAPYELASELSFLLTGTMPDDALLAAAGSGSLATPADLRREAARLLATPAARAQRRLLIDDWLATSRLASVVKDPAAYPGFDGALQGAMRSELDLFYDFAVSDRGTLADLFGDSTSFVDARLARHYGSAGGATDADFPPIALDPGTRSGVLTRGGFLTVHSGYGDSNPIERGVFVLSALLCTPPRPPPPDIPRTVPPDDTRTTRDRYAAHASNPFCQGCHAAIDGVGFGLEQFDGVGATRTQENGYPVDTSGLLVDGDGTGAPFVGGSQLGALLVASPRLSQCFVRQVYRFALGVAESPADQPTIDDLSGGFTAQSAIDALLLDLVGRRAFLERWTQEAQP
ncbi:MAG TPA: DUF1592 domain-containing protein [Polyangiaceae bacterium]